ncbi:MAG: proteasome accessory factor PafA2 family protein [Acidimicrobiia bacterium]|nr:proteasome accessory factor PafA2 family protein [Acidimicrobiia bacterium]
MRRRIFGLEQEYGVAGTDATLQPCVADRMVRPLARRNRTTSLDLSTFLDNGGRVYVDTGQHPEYATPECDSVLELLRYHRAGDVLMDSLRRRAEIEISEEYARPTPLTVLKNNLDSRGTTYGCHENYLLPRSVHMQFATAVLVPFLVSRQIWAGAGAVLPPDPEAGRSSARFVIGQRALAIESVVGTCTTQQRPIVNARDEPHAEARRYRRLHLVLGDANMGDVPTFLKVAVTGMVLDVIEAAGVVRQADDLVTVPSWWPAPVELWPMAGIALSDPITSLRRMSEDLTCRRSVPLAGGGRLSPLDIQWRYVELVDSHFLRHQMTQEQRLAFGMWVAILEMLEIDPARAHRHVDWVAKLRLLDRAASRGGWGMADPEARAIDFLFHDISESGLHARLTARGLVETLVSAHEVGTCVGEPPLGTRARLRADVIRRARELGARIVADWSMCKVALPNAEWSTVSLADPFVGRDPAAVTAALPEPADDVLAATAVPA